MRIVKNNIIKYHIGYVYIHKDDISLQRDERDYIVSNLWDIVEAGMGLDTTTWYNGPRWEIYP